MKKSCAESSFGAVVPFTGSSTDNQIQTDNLYSVDLCHVSCIGDGIEYKSARHLFTEKELQRATLRYYSECSNLDQVPFTKSQYADASRGYVGLRTYVNHNGDLTTRFVVRFDGSKVECLGSGTCVGLFTAREMKRSVSRTLWFKFSRFGWIRKLVARLYRPSSKE